MTGTLLWVFIGSFNLVLIPVQVWLQMRNRRLRKVTLAKAIPFINGSARIWIQHYQPRAFLMQATSWATALKFSKLHSFKWTNSYYYRHHGNRNVGNRAIWKPGQQSAYYRQRFIPGNSDLDGLSPGVWFVCSWECIQESSWQWDLIFHLSGLNLGCCSF